MLKTAAFWIVAISAMAASSLVAHFAPAPIYSIVWGTLASLAAGLVARWFAGRNNLTPAEIGLGWRRTTPRRALLGMAIGVAVYAATLAFDAAIFGAISLVPVQHISVTAIGLTLAGLIATIAMEEIVFRSFALWNSVVAIGIWPAQAVVALAFAALHIGYGWPVSTVFLGVLPSAVLFGTAAVVSRGLALPWGIHFGMVAARTLSGEGNQPLLFTLEAGSFNAAAAANWGPLIGAAVPLFAASLLWRRRAA